MKLCFSILPSSNSSFDQNLSSKKLQQCSYENVYIHYTLHTNKSHIFVNNKFSSLFSPLDKYALDCSHLHGGIRKNDLLKDYFIYYSETNLCRPLFVPREALSTHDSHFNVYNDQPLPTLTTQTHSIFQHDICQPFLPTAFRLYNLLLTFSYIMSQLHLCITNSIYHLQTTQPPANNTTSTHGLL